MKKAGPTECSYVVGHGQLLIKQNAQVVDLACRLYGGVRQDQRLFRDFIQLLTCSQPDNLRLVFVKLETIIGHPVADQSDTVAEASQVSSLISLRRQLLVSEPQWNCTCLLRKTEITAQLLK